MKAGEYDINTFNFRKLLSHILNPPLIIPGVNTQKAVLDSNGDYETMMSIVRDLEEDYDLSSMSREEAMEALATNALGYPMVFPLELQMEGGEWWKLPFEPLITITGKNVIIKKRVSKGSVRGTIKERWCQDDYQINIEGILINTQNRGSYPNEDVMKLRRHCEAAKLKVRGPLFELFSINQIVVEDYDFPATTGEENQAYKIKASSDDIYKLLLKKEDLKQL